MVDRLRFKFRVLWNHSTQAMALMFSNSKARCNQNVQDIKCYINIEDNPIKKHYYPQI